MSNRDILLEYEKQREYNKNKLEKRFLHIIYDNPKIKSIEEEIQKLDKIRVENIFNFVKEEENKKISEKIKSLEKQKQKEIEKLNLPDNYLSNTYNCGECKDTGFIKRKGKTQKCSCFTQKILNKNYNSSNINNLEKEDFESFKLDYYSDKIDEKYNSDKSPRQNMKEIYDLSVKFAEDFGNKEVDNRNLFFTGPTGLGKTFLSNAIANEVIKKGYTVFYQTSPILFEQLMQNKFDDLYEYNKLSLHLQNVDLLIIDDFGMEYLTESRLVDIFNIINGRILKGKSTIISSNLGIADIHNSYDDRISSRISGYYTAKRFYGDDIRIIKRVNEIKNKKEKQIEKEKRKID